METIENVSLTLPPLGAVQMNVNQRSVVNYVRSGTTEDHFHMTYELYVHVTGDISFAVNDTIYRMEPGDVVLTKPNTFHHSVCHSDCLHTHYCIFLQTADPTLCSLLDPLADRGCLRYEKEDAAAMAELLENMTAALSSPLPLPLPEKLYFFSRLLSLLTRGMERPSAAGQYPETLRLILAYIGQNYARITSVGTLCDRFFISQATLERLFSRYLHMTPHKYVEAARLAAACRLLSGNPEISVRAAAEQCGFSDCSHFIALFRRAMGVTPSRYRRENAAR